MEHWQTIASIISTVIAVGVLMVSLFGRSLSIREHDEFCRHVDARFNLLEHNFDREIARIDDKLNHRSTTG